MSALSPTVGSISASLEKIHGSWGWFVVLGIALLVLGVVCILADVSSTLLSVLALGWLLLIGAVVALVQSIRAHNWSGFLLYFLTALLRGVAGYLLVRYPLLGEVSITLLLAALFIVGGIFRVVGASTLRFASWGWTAVSGIVSLLVGFALIYTLPLVSLFFIGILVGVDFIFDGVALATLGAAVKRSPAAAQLAEA